MRLAVIIDPLRRVAIILASSALLSPLPATAAAEQAEQAQVRRGSLAEPEPASDAARRKTPAVGVGVGVALERRQSSDPIGSDEWGVSFLPRFIKRGLAPAVSLPWTRVAAGGPMRSGNTDVGSIRMRPTMIGVTWQEPIGKGLTAELRLTGGYSFNAVRQPDPTRGAQDAGPPAFTNADGSMAWEPRLAVWRDVGPRTGIMMAVRYLHTRPMLTFTDGTRYRLNADRLTFELGFAFTLLKAPRAQ